MSRPGTLVLVLVAALATGAAAPKKAPPKKEAPKKEAPKKEAPKKEAPKDGRQEKVAAPEAPPTSSADPTAQPQVISAVSGDAPAAAATDLPPPPLVGLVDAPRTVPSRNWRVAAAAGVDLGGAGLSPSAGASLSVRRSVVARDGLAFELGGRLGYGHRRRTAELAIPGEGLDRAAILVAHTGDVSMVAGTVFDLGASPFEIGLEAGVGLAWRSGAQSLLGRTHTLPPVGFAQHVSAQLGWRASDSVRLALRLESSSQPLVVPSSAPALPPDLGAVRTLLLFELLP